MKQQRQKYSKRMKSYMAWRRGKMSSYAKWRKNQIKEGIKLGKAYTEAMKNE